MTSRSNDALHEWLLRVLAFVLGLWAASGFLFWIGVASFDALWGSLT